MSRAREWERSGRESDGRERETAGKGATRRMDRVHAIPAARRAPIAS
jgi:hypothetical protein